jgi:hypothetical protein
MAIDIRMLFVDGVTKAVFASQCTHDEDEHLPRRKIAFTV